MDGVLVALFRQKELPVHRIVLVQGVPRDERIEYGGGTVRLGTEDPAQPLGFLLAGPEGAGYLDRHVGVRQVDGEIGDLGHHETLELAVSEPGIQIETGLQRRAAGDQGKLEQGGDLLELSHVQSDDQDLVRRMLFQQRADDLRLPAVFRGDPELLPAIGHGVGHAPGFGQVDPDFTAVGLRDPALPLEQLPGHVVPPGTDEAEDVVLAAVFADQGGGQPEAPAGLDLGRVAKHRGREQVNLVIDDEAPSLLVEESEMLELVSPALPVRQDLVGGQRYRADLFRFP